MYLPQIDDERDTLCNYLEVQLDALRASVHGLTDEQAKRRPLRSALSLAGILKHISFCMSGALVGARRKEAEALDEDFADSFEPGEESLAGILERFDALREAYMEMCRDGDLEIEMQVGPFPWYGMDEARPAKLRYLYVHHVEEFARHAGHADIIREQIDGAQSPSLLSAIEGWEPNDYVTPWRPEPRES